MKRRLTLLIALVLSIVLVSLMNSVSTVEAQQGDRRLNYDTGVFPLGQSQMLRVTVSVISGNNSTGVQFRRMSYGQEVCNGGICKSLINNEQWYPPSIIDQNEAVWIDIDRNPDSPGFRAIVNTNRPARVVVMLIDTSTGEIVWADELKGFVSNVPGR